MTKDKKEKFEPVFLNSLTLYREQLQHPPEYLSTGTPIDELLHGGFRFGELAELAGEYGTGKSQICFTVSATTPHKVLFVDVEHTYRPERIVQIADARGLDSEKVLDKIIVVRPVNSDEQLELLKVDLTEKPFKNKYIPKDTRLIVIDSLLAHFRAEYTGRENLSERQQLIGPMLNGLKWYAKENSIAVVMTNQVQADPGASIFLPLEYRQKAVGGHTVYHAIDTRIFLRKSKDNSRIAKLMDSSWLEPGECEFRIGPMGVTSVGD